MTEATIVGGGLAGAAAATLLARSGRRVVVLERETAPRDKICGEFLSIGAQRRLRALGLDPATLTDVRIDTLRLTAGDRTARAPLPFEALGLTRRRLDAALLDHAAAAGVDVMRGVHVRAVETGRLQTSVGERPAPILLLASGKHEVRGAARSSAGTANTQVGFKMYWQLPPAARQALAGHIDIVLFPGGYAGLQLVEGGVANLCLTLKRDRLAAIGDWPALLDRLLAIPHLRRILGGAEPLLDKPLTISGVPYGYRHAPQPGETAYRLGDQAAVIPSFCGDGMAMALASAFRCAAAIGDGVPPAIYHRDLRRGFARQLAIAGALQRVGFARPVQPFLPPIVAAMPWFASRLAALTRVAERDRVDPLQ